MCLRNFCKLLLPLCLFILFSSGCFEKDSHTANQSHEDDDAVVTHHKIIVHGKPLAYTARAGYLSIRDESQKIHGRVFYVSYTLDNPASPNRPLLFAWNGGPGANAAPLHLEVIGPRRIKQSVEYTTRHSVPELIDNEDTWLQFADLVFVDPVNTGYSYATTPNYLDEFLNDKGDAESMVEFIRLYLSHYAVEKSPLFIMGESYGTFRAAKVAELLGERKIPLRGMIFLSTILNMQGYSTSDLSIALRLSSYTAAAFVHHRLSSRLQANFHQTISEAEHWAENIYLPALVRGDRINAEQEMEIANGLAMYTGIPAQIWRKNKLQLNLEQFAKEVLGSENMQYVGHFDTRMIGKLAHKGDVYTYPADPSLEHKGLHELIVSYLRKELNWFTDAPYVGPFDSPWSSSAASSQANWTMSRWKVEPGDDRNRNTAMAKAMQQNPDLRAFVASGYFDINTPFAITEYTISHLALDQKLQNHIQVKRYTGGHSIYLDQDARASFTKDVREFIQNSGSSPYKGAL